MKTKTLLLLFLLISGMMSAQVKRVAILETVDKQNNVSYANKVILRNTLSRAITNTPGYEAYDRTDIDAIMSEHSFQRTGLVSNDQIKRLGEMTGANYILVAEAVQSGSKKLFVTAKLLDVETARTIITEMREIKIDNMQTGCDILAKKMFPGRKKDTHDEQFLQVSDGPQIVKHSKIDQRLLGVKKYSCGDVQMDQKALEGFLRNNSYDVYKRYLRGQSCIYAGWATMGVGAITMLIGGITFGISEKYAALKWDFVEKLNNEYGYNYADDRYSGFTKWTPDDKRSEYFYNALKFYNQKDADYDDWGRALLGAGGGIMAISVPLLGIGYGIKNNIYKHYNEHPNYEPVFTLNLQSNQNGIGLALTF